MSLYQEIQYHWLFSTQDPFHMKGVTSECSQEQSVFSRLVVVSHMKKQKKKWKKTWLACSPWKAVIWRRRRNIIKVSQLEIANKTYWCRCGSMKNVLPYHSAAGQIIGNPPQKSQQILEVMNRRNKGMLSFLWSYWRWGGSFGDYEGTFNASDY